MPTQDLLAKLASNASRAELKPNRCLPSQSWTRTDLNPTVNWWHQWHQWHQRMPMTPADADDTSGRRWHQRTPARTPVQTPATPVALADDVCACGSVRHGPHHAHQSFNVLIRIHTSKSCLFTLTVFLRQVFHKILIYSCSGLSLETFCFLDLTKLDESHAGENDNWQVGTVSCLHALNHYFKRL